MVVASDCDRNLSPGSYFVEDVDLCISPRPRKSEVVCGENEAKQKQKQSTPYSIYVGIFVLLCAYIAIEHRFSSSANTREPYEERALILAVNVCTRSNPTTDFRSKHFFRYA